MKTLREHSFFAAFFGGLFLYFLWPLILLKKSFVLGDYGIQFFPWSYLYAQSLKAGTLPYWTFQIGNGFPLVAEGQVAAYYPIHLILYRLLPFLAAYSTAIWVHFLLGGIGFYVYGQKIGLRKEPATLAAMLFSFSSAYGGCFYTTGTLRVLSWLPWAMWALCLLRERTDRRGLVRPTLLLAAFMAQMWLAGFPQMALYAVGYLGLAALFEKNLRLVLLWLAASALGMVLALPQIAATLELAAVSVRAGESAAFALWGSVPPPAVVGLAYPEWGNFLRVSFYIGALPLLFAAYELFSPAKTKNSRTHLWLALIFLLLAFGKYNPLYVWAVEAFSFTFLRNPSKYLFFTTVSMAVVSAFGMQRWLFASESARLRKTAWVFGVVLLALPVAGGLLLKTTHTILEKEIPSMAEAIHAEKNSPSKGVEEYARQLTEMLGRAEGLFDIKNPHLWAAFLFVLAAAVTFVLGLRRRRMAPYLAAVLVALNLIYYAHFFGTGFLGNMEEPKMFEHRAEAEAIRKILPFPEAAVAENAVSRDEEWFEPSKSLFYGLRHAGVYSPLMIKDYYESTKDLGFVDASLGRQPFRAQTWDRKKPLLDSLGVGALLSLDELDLKGWEKAGKIGGRFAYRNPSAQPPVPTPYPGLRTEKDRPFYDASRNHLWEVIALAGWLFWLILLLWARGPRIV